MSHRRLGSRFARRSALSMLLLAGMGLSAHAASGTWNVNANSNWGTAASWVGSTVASGTGFTANFTFNITADRTVTNEAARTIGNIVFTDSTTDSNNLIIAGTNVLTLDVSLNQSQINVTQAARTLTISAPLAGNDGVQKIGPGTLTLSGNNTISGNFLVDAGTLIPANANALGTTTVFYNSGSTGSTAFTGGISYANNITLLPGVTGTVGVGSIRHSGGGGVAQLNGTISLQGVPGSGGTFGGSNTVGQELRINGAVNDATAGYSQRNGRVIYAGGGNSVGQFTITDTALLGANNGLPQGLSVLIGGSSAATLTLNGFSQTLNNTNAATYAMTITNGGNSGTLDLSTGTLTLNGDLLSGGTVASTINSGAGGTLAWGATPRILQVTNTTANGLAINNATITGTGGITKNGVGNLTLNGATFNNPLTIDTGSLRGSGTLNNGLTVNTGANLTVGTIVTAGTMTASQINFGAGTTTLDFSTGAPGLADAIVNPGTLTQAGTTTINFGVPVGNFLTPSTTYPIIPYTGTSPGTSGFILGTVPQRAAANIVDTGTSIAVAVGTLDKVIWTGATDGIWDVNTTQNWKLQSNSAATGYQQGDDLIFDDTGLNTNTTGITLNAPVAPTRLDFQNTTTVPYVISGTGSLTGAGQIVKSGNGTATIDLSGTSTLAGATTVTAGTLEIKQANLSYVTAVQNANALFDDNLNVATGAKLRLSSNNVAFTVARDVVGAGTVELDSTAGGTAASLNVTISGNNTGFTGLWKLTASGSVPGNGTFRTANATAQANLGSAAIDVDNGAQLWYTGALNNNITITGSGFQEVAGGVPVAGVIAEGLPSYSGIGAIRMTGGALSGNITLDGTAKITSWNASTTISGNITNTNSTDTLVVAGSGNVGANQTQTLILTGNNLGLEKIWINSGTQQTGAFTNSTLLQIGNGGTTGTLGSGNVIMHSDTPTAGTIQTILDIRRSDGYTLAANQSILADSTSGSSFGNNVLFVNTTGTGLVLGSTNTIDLTDAAGLMTTPTAGGVVRVGSAANNSLLDLQTGSLLRAGNLHVGEAANFAGVVNQAAGSAVELVNQFRVGHFSTQTSTYNMNGGTFTMIGGSPATTPSGGSEQNGGMYVGVDGRGIFNQSNGTVTTNFVVLDNRGTTDTGANMNAGGVDQYNLSGGTLNVRSTWGIIQRQNNTGEFNLSGGTIRVDDTGTGTGTGANIVVPIDSTLNVSGIASVLDTNAGTNAGNGFALRRSVFGSGTVTTQGGGNVTFNPVGSESGSLIQTVSATVAGNSPIVKDGAGSVTIFQSPQTYTSNTAVNAGVLLINNTLASPLVTVADGAAVGGEQTITALTVGSSAGGTVFFNPVTSGALTVGTYTANGTTLVDFSAVPVGSGPFTVLNYTTNTTPGSAYALANASSYRGAPTVADSGAGPGAVTLNGLTTKNLTWTGSVNNTWDSGATANTNWTDGSPDNFYSYDSVTFSDTAPPTATTVTATGVVQPSSITVNSSTNNYTINGVISGAGSLTKSGSSTLTLGGANLFLGPVTINGGIVSITGTNNIGSGLPGNDINLNGGTLRSVIGTDNTILNLGINRILNVGASGGTLSSNSGTGRTTTVSGPITGSGALTFTGGGTFDVRGNNTGFNGPVSVNSTIGGGGTTLFLTSPLSNTTVTVEPGTVTANAANTLQFNGLALPASTNIIAKATHDGTNGFRSSLTSNAPGGAINGTIQLEATASPLLTQLVQFNAGGSTAVSNFDVNGPVSATMAGFNGTMFIRGVGLGRINNTVNLPNGALTKTDTGVWEINSSGNTWTTTTVAVGTLRTMVANALPATAGIVMGQNDNNTAVLDLNGFNATATSLASNPTTTGANTTGKSITSVAPATLTINQATNTTYASVLTGALSLVKSDVGTLSLNGVNTYTGTTTVSGGTLSLGTGSARGTSAINVGSGATAEINGTNLFVTGHGVAVDNARVITVDAGTLLATANADTRIGNVTLTNGATWTSNRGLGAFDLLLADTSTGAATVTVSGTGAATMNGTGGIHMLGVQNFNVADTVAGSASDLNVSMILGNSGSQGANSPGGFNKLGAGTMSLSGTNTYTGATNITAGTLRINGDNSAATGAVTVSALATLGGSGTIGGSTTVASTGIVAPGNSAGNLTFGNGVDLSAGGVYSWELGALSTSNPGTDFDTITVSNGNLALAGTSALTLDFALLGANGPNSANAFWTSPQTWKIIDVTGTGTNTGSTILGSITNPTYTSGSFAMNPGAGGDLGDVFLVFTPSVVGPSVWQGANNDNWTAGTSWSGSVPNSATAEAKFTTLGGATANLDVNQTVNKLTFDATTGNDYTVSGPGTLTLAGTTPSISTTVGNTGDQIVAVNLDLAAGTSVSVQGGTLALNSPANAVLGDGVTATVATGATLSLGGAGNALSNGTSTHANVANSGTLVATTAGKRVGEISGSGTTTVTAAGATLTANHIRQSTLNIGAGNTVTVATNGGNSGTSTVTNLNINATGKLDLANNDLIVDNGNLATLTAKLASGLDINGTYGNGPGITSSAFASNPNFNTVLGIAANVELGYTSFSGQTVDANDILIKYTYYGDADLSGSVDTSTDFDLYITGLTSGGSLGGWLFGDFDYSGTVDSSTDFDLYITGLTTQGGALLTAGGGGNLVQAVPEPSTFVLGGLALLGFAGVGLRRRRLAKPQA